MPKILMFLIKIGYKLKLVKNTEAGPAYKIQIVFKEDELREKNKTSLKCPLCGEEIKDDRFGWKCQGCGFTLNYSVSGKELSVSDLEPIINDGETKVIKGFMSKSGKKFDAKLILDKETKRVNFSFGK